VAVLPTEHLDSKHTTPAPQPPVNHPIHKELKHLKIYVNILITVNWTCSYYSRTSDFLCNACIVMFTSLL